MLELKFSIVALTHAAENLFLEIIVDHHRRIRQRAFHFLFYISYGEISEVHVTSKLIVVVCSLVICELLNLF